jgi:hypothetical protein
VPRRRKLPPAGLDRLLARLEQARRERADQRGVEKVLGELERAEIRDGRRLLEYHDALLYFAAFPSRPSVRRRAERALSRFAPRIEALRAAGADFSVLEESGIAGTSVAAPFSFDFLRRLVERGPRTIRILWELDPDPDRLAAALPRFVPLLEEESLVDANVPYAEWVAAARGRRGSSLDWLLRRFEALPLPAAAKAELYDALALPVEWELGRSRDSRTRLRLPERAPFFHGRGLLPRRGLDLRTEIADGPLEIERLSRSEAARALEAARAALAVRFREFHGFNNGDPGVAFRARAGRGLRIHWFGLEPERRLPLRAGFAQLVSRNGVPIAYGDGFVLFERVDLSFNVFPEFRDGESAHVLASVMRLYRRALGTSVFSIDPYQIGFGNEEAIASGAFWFYRRLGFRSTRPELERIARREEARIAADPRRRSSPRTLARLAGSNLLFDLAESGRLDWDRFHIRNVGLSVDRRLAASGLSAERFRERCAARLARRLHVDSRRWAPGRRRAFEDWALVLDGIPGLSRWSVAEKSLLARILAAKAARSEIGYARSLARHERLRAAVLRMGS